MFSQAFLFIVEYVALILSAVHIHTDASVCIYSRMHTYVCMYVVYALYTRIYVYMYIWDETKSSYKLSIVWILV
jgi:hypothetical protein